MRWLRLLVLIPFVGFPFDSRAATVADFFNDQKLQDVQVRMAATDWQSLKDKYLENTYYKVEFEWNGLVVKDVGIRSRGSGSRNAIKPAIGFDFTKYNKTQRFLDLRALTLRNFVQDPSLVHERLAQKLFHRMGLPSSRTAYLRLFINGDYVGLYLGVEPLDERFLRTHLGDENGYLYELAATGYEFADLGDDPSVYARYFDPKTHSSDPQFSKLAEWIRAMNNSSDADFAKQMAKYVDVQEFLTHVAIDQTTGDWDSTLSTDGMTNIYLARRSDSSTFVFVTWDKDMTLSTSNLSIWRNTDLNLLMRRSLAIPEYRWRFLEAAWQAADAMGGEGGWFWQDATNAWALVKDAANADPNLVCVGETGIARCAFKDIQANYDYTMGNIRLRADFVKNELKSSGYDPARMSYALRSGDVRSTGTSEPDVAPLSLAYVNIAGITTNEIHATALPLPTDLGGLRVLMNGTAVPVFYANQNQILVEIPAELTPGPIPVTVAVGNRFSSTVYVENRPAVPSLLAVTHASGTIVTATDPARPGEWLVLWGNGMMSAKSSTGVTLKTGEAAPAGPLVDLGSSATIMIGDQTIAPVWAGFAPGMVGFDQIVFQLPQTWNWTGAQPLTVVSNGEPAASVVVQIAK
jgi:uncharacterized protein (TIGR03437 family)